jgi:mono/diheme cytochrome c family protein
MRFTLILSKSAVLLLLGALLGGCGGSGDEYDGFDDEVTLSTPDKYLRFFNQQDGDLDDTAYAVAYNAAVDPGGARSTLEKYIALHGLENPDVHVVFRDSKDLGYGRDMYMRSYMDPMCGQITAFYVRNFSVEIVDGFAYGPVNLEAAIAEDLTHHVGTNAIEFGRGVGATDTTCSIEPMTKFFTFDPVPIGAQARRLRVDLDGRGEKAMPQPCVSCHGGKLRPLDRNGDFVAIHADDPADQIGDVKARLQAFEVDTFEFSDAAGYSRAEQEEGLRMLNLAIYCSYPDSENDGDVDFVEQDCSAFNYEAGGGVAEQANNGEWQGDFAREMLLGWYSDALDTPGATFSDAYIPDGWQPGGATPVGADALFTKVVGPNCFVCHGKQGVQLGTNGDTTNGKDLDFRTWDKFISYADDIERLVFDEGRMPLGLLNYQTFWDDPQKAELLASFIAPYVSNSAGFEARRTDANGGIILPGRVVARAGPDRVTGPVMPVSPITLDASASLFADSYRWELLSSPPASTTTLTSPNSKRTDFSADTVGNYVVRLTATSSKSGSSNSDTLTILLDGTLAAPRGLQFYPDITAEFALARGTGRECFDCHQEFGGVGGVPMWWTADATQPFNVPPVPLAGTPSLGLYEQAMTRVMPEYIEDSLLLKKPSGQHHYGDLVDGFDTSLPVGAAGRASYDLFVNWIAEGAVCGGTVTECP